MTLAQARATANREAMQTVAICRENGATAAQIWRDLTSLKRPSNLSWRHVEGVIAAIAYDRLIRADAAQRTA